MIRKGRTYMYSKKERIPPGAKARRALQDLFHKRGREIVEGEPGNDEVVTDVRFKCFDAANMHACLAGSRLEDGIALKALPQ